MAEKGTQNPATGTESDISKAQSQQKPPNQASQEPGETGERQDQFKTGHQGQQFGQDLTDEAAERELQGDTITGQRTDTEGASLQSPETGEAESGFVGAEGRQDTSGELVEDEDFDEDDEAAPEGE